MVLLLILINNDLVHAQETSLSKHRQPSTLLLWKGGNSAEARAREVSCFCTSDTDSYHKLKARNIRASQSINPYREDFRDEGNDSKASKGDEGPLALETDPRNYSLFGSAKRGFDWPVAGMRLLSN